MPMVNALFVGTNSYILADVPSAFREIGRSVVKMRVLMSPIDAIVTHSKQGVLRPEKYRIMEAGETVVVRIDKILTRSEEKSMGCLELIFGCQGVINGKLKIFELKYRIPSCQWFLYRI